MTKLVNKFIEDNIELIEQEMYDDLYDAAYDELPDDYVKELTETLSAGLNIDFEEYAKQNILKHLDTELMNFVQQKQHHVLTLATFVRMFMNHVNGIDWDEFQLLVEKHLANNKFVKTYDDGVGELFISKVRVI